ncbi:hypothetical protein K402DRAFT_24650 [Aulographum hederae CBS 113979]|uniref:Uncharacterized protein n=1 Tax=Aulographum hederae CBS 113979 TaxID=1176131 RepID=A0A6G1H5Z8_9PEZI|nr:hypothetical protein K402DRAFT_24650 [Aulographum hederae CBS 113979]
MEFYGVYECYGNVFGIGQIGKVDTRGEVVACTQLVARIFDNLNVAVCMLCDSSPVVSANLQTADRHASEEMLASSHPTSESAFATDPNFSSSLVLSGRIYEFRPSLQFENECGSHIIGIGGGRRAQVWLTFPFTISPKNFSLVEGRTPSSRLLLPIPEA